MAENFPFTKKQMGLLMGGVLLAAFLGILGGSYFVRMKTADASSGAKNVLLKKGQEFPGHHFLSLDGKPVDFARALDGKKTILFFLTTGCPHCNDLTERWRPGLAKIGSDYQILGVSYEPTKKLMDFQMEQNFPFPLYNDSIGKFTGKYKIVSSPTLIGVDEKGKIVFVEVGNNKEKKLEDYLKLL